MSAETVNTHEPATQRLVPGLFRAIRARQWVKNVLVAAAPLAGGVLLQRGVLLHVAIAFAAFCLAASGIYLVNDVRDIESDRSHPTKRNRPIAAGVVSIPIAWSLAVLLLITALGVCLVVNVELLLVVAVYEAVQLAYCFGLKHQPVLDLCIVASGFLLRAVAGGAAAQIPLSQWFLMCAGFGSLFMVAGKRYAEIRLSERTGVVTRRILHSYTASYLRFVWTLAASGVVTAYSLWSFEIRAQNDSPWSVVSIVPFVIAVLRYAVDVDGGDAGEPEDIALRDRVLQVLGTLWLITLALSVYA
ncbi:MAG: decaprenyl-phosphate phosphoribosyltransferase [Geodermatophilaceae bacterium]|nr:decaprenyl-phosphate phosphoribosyltransferase [Geodermatophilaceae bacterium]